MRIFGTILIAILFISLLSTWGGASYSLFTWLTAPSIVSVPIESRLDTQIFSLISTMLLIIFFNGLLIALYRGRESIVANVAGIIFELMAFAFIYIMTSASLVMSKDPSYDIAHLGFGPFLAIATLFCLLVIYVIQLLVTSKNKIKRIKLSKSIVIAWIIGNILLIGYIFYSRWDAYKPYVPSSQLQTITSSHCPVSFHYPNDWVASNDDEFSAPKQCSFSFKHNRFTSILTLDSTKLSWSQIVQDHAMIKPTKIGQHEVLIIPQDISDELTNQIYFRIGDKVFASDFSNYADPEAVKVLYQIIASGK